MTLAKTLLVDLRPRAVLGLGGFAAGAIVRAAAKRHIPAALLNPDAVPGLANRYLAGRVDAIFTQFASTADCFAPRLRGRVHAVGCPVRPRLTDGDREEAIAHFGLRSDRRTLLVFGGSTLAASLSDAVAALGEAWSEFADDWQLLVVAGAGRREEVEQALSGRIPAVATDYCRRMDLAYAVADLALARGGAVTVAELASTGTPAVILPYPHHRDRQQYLNASELVRAGAAVVADDRCDADANAEVLRGKLFAILRDKAKHAAMQSAARSPGGSDAARGVAQWMVERQHGGA
jgi:UDP-N-acetylglucosamine--N-acetylmuramyl-(pentapeptide) pyrophosphoryl-undecaprenol N-acetylglucosamine transferase